MGATNAFPPILHMRVVIVELHGGGGMMSDFRGNDCSNLSVPMATISHTVEV